MQKLALGSITAIGKKLGVFDTLLMMGNNFGLLGNPKRGRWLLRRFFRATSETGLIIATTRDPYQTKSPEHLAYHKLNRSRGRLGGQIRIRTRYKTLIGEWIEYWMVSKEEMELFMKGTGWTVSHWIEGEDSMYTALIEKEKD